VSGSTNQNVNPYGRWGSSTFAGPSQTINTQSGANANGRAGGFSSSTGAKGAGYQNAVTGGSGGAVKTQGGDVYAGHDGNVYKHSDSGWEKYDKGSGWNPVQPPANHPSPAAGTPANLGASQGNRGAAVDSGNYQQLEQDRLGRQAGGGHFGGARDTGGGRQSSSRNRR